MGTQANASIREPEKRSLKNANTGISQGNLPLGYFVLVFVLAVPFWLF